MVKIKLSAARVNAGLSQLEAANMLGKSKATLISWEKGRAKIDLANLLLLSRIYKMPVEMIDVEVKGNGTCGTGQDIGEATAN